MATQLNDTTYADVRGFNYVPSYAATIWDAIDDFDRDVWDREFGFAKRFGSNALRIWCDYLSFQKDERRFLAVWRDALELAERHGLRLMVTVSNRWTDGQWPYGQLDLASVIAGVPSPEYERYLTTFVSTFRDDARILMWDLCNEPFSRAWPPNRGPFPPSDGPFAEELARLEMGFWEEAAAIVRSARPSQPITIGLHPLEPYYPAAVHELVDVISCHPYDGWWDGGAPFLAECDKWVGLANELGKPLVCSETCQGSRDDETRRELIGFCIRSLEERSVGWLAWQLMAGQVVSGRPDRVDTNNSRPGDEGPMYFVRQDGTTRPGHELADWRTW
jgi:hypothetical protein